MDFELSVFIRRSPTDVFNFLRDKDLAVQKEGSPVILLEKTTSGPTGVGTRYRELVQMLPFIRGEILSEITRYEPNQYLEERFEGAGMKGYLVYQFLQEDDGTRLVQRQTLLPQGMLSLLEPIIHPTFSRRIRERLDAIKHILEHGYDSKSIRTEH